MNISIFKSIYYWQNDKIESSINEIELFLQNELKSEDIFVLNKDEIPKNSSFTLFLNSILANDKRVCSFNDSFFSIIKNCPINEVFNILVTHNYLEESIIETLNLEELGYKIPIEGQHVIDKSIIWLIKNSFLSTQKNEILKSKRIVVYPNDIAELVKEDWTEEMKAGIIKALKTDIVPISYKEQMEKHANLSLMCFLFNYLSNFGRSDNDFIPELMELPVANPSYVSELKKLVERIILNQSDEEINEMLKYSCVNIKNYEPIKFLKEINKFLNTRNNDIILSLNLLDG